eukprot:Colp12_sorted_trinity150504_noHs@3976
MLKFVILCALSTLTWAGYPPLPMITTSGFGRGINIINEASLVPVVRFTYGDGADTYMIPFLNQTFMVPKEVVVVNTPEGRDYEATQMVTHLEEFTHAYSSSHYFGLDIGFLAFSGSKATKQMSDLLQNKSSTVYISERTFPLYELQSWPLRVLDTQQNGRFATKAKALPLVVAGPADLEAYDSFIQEFGCGVVTRAKAGGTRRYTVFVDTSLFSTKSLDYVESQVNIAVTYYDITVGFGAAHSKQTQTNDQDFKTHASIKLECTGGDVTLCDTTTLTTTTPLTAIVPQTDAGRKWVKTVYQNPAVFDQVYTPTWLALSGIAAPEQQRGVETACRKMAGGA